MSDDAPDLHYLFAWLREYPQFHPYVVQQTRPDQEEPQYLWALMPSTTMRDGFMSMASSPQKIYSTRLVYDHGCWVQCASLLSYAFRMLNKRKRCIWPSCDL